MYSTFHPSRRKRAILYHLLAVGSLLLPQVTCQFVFPYPPLPSNIFTTQAQCRAYYNICMDAFRDCLSAADPNNSSQRNCEDWRNNTCEDTIRMGCDGLPNEKRVGAGGTLGGGTLGMGMPSSDGSLSVPPSSNTPALKSTPTVSLPSITSFPPSVLPQPTQIGDSTSPIPTASTPTSTQAFPSPTTPPIISPTFFSSFTTAVVTSTITTTQTFATGASTWTATMTRTTITTQRRGLNFTGISNDSARPWCRAGVGVGFLFFWSVVGWAGYFV